jgi:hypothetical protein
VTLESYILKYNSTHPRQEPDVPEKALIAAVLRRAIFDLLPHVSRSDRYDAIAWFYGKEARISFADCIDTLDLGSSFISSIMTKVAQLEKSYESSRNPST